MNSPADDIKDILVSESSLGLTFGTDLFVGREPEKPKNCVTVYDTTALPPDMTFLVYANGEFYERPAVQVRVRNNDYRNGYDLILNIMLALHGRGQETWNDTLYTLIRCSNGPTLLEWDENNRVKFIANFEIQRRQ